MQQILFIGLGGFMGSASRYLVSRYFNDLFVSFPMGTLVVNFTGSFLLGFLTYAFLHERAVDPQVRNMVTVGFLGAYTTMSSFALESVRLVEISEYATFILNVLVNVGLCLTAVVLGKMLVISLYR
jgi:CrcB protein